MESDRVILKPISILDGYPVGKIIDTGDKWCCKLSLKKGESLFSPQIIFYIPRDGIVRFYVCGRKSSGGNVYVTVFINDTDFGSYYSGEHTIRVFKGDKIAIRFDCYDYEPNYTIVCLSKNFYLEQIKEIKSVAIEKGKICFNSSYDGKALLIVDGEKATIKVKKGKNCICIGYAMKVCIKPI